MTIVFDEFELDSARRELRMNGEVQTVQPQVFDLLFYLVDNRERVVPKRELLEALWPDSIVTESSIQRAVSLARSALGQRGAELIQTFPRQGYRFIGRVEEKKSTSARLTLQPKYTKSGDVHIAYTTFGSGDVDIVVVNGWIMPMRGMFQYHRPRGILEALSKIGRVIMFDKRGTGLSDRVKDLPSHEQRMDDLRVVLDACGSERAVLVGFSEGGALAMLYAATYPERSQGLILAGAFARMTTAPNYPFGYSADAMKKLRGYIRGSWGKGASLRAIAPSQKDDPEFMQWVTFAEQEGASPGGALDLLNMNLQIDLRALLPSIRIPTAVLQALDDKMIDPKNGPYLAEHIPGARYVEVPGDDHLFILRGPSHLLEALDWIRSQEPLDLDDDRFLSTALVGHAHEDVEQEAWLGGVHRFRGQPVPGTRHAYFDGPIRALRCATALAAELPVSCGIHTGEVVRQGATATGQAFTAAEEIARGAPRGEVRASQVVLDLVPGSDLTFEPTGVTTPLAGREIAVFSVKSDN